MSKLEKSEIIETDEDTRIADQNDDGGSIYPFDPANENIEISEDPFYDINDWFTFRRYFLALYSGNGTFFIRTEGFNTPPFRAVKKVLNPECNHLTRTTCLALQGEVVD